MDVDLAFSKTLRTVGEFMAMVSTKRKQKKNQAKTATIEKKRRSLTPFSLQLALLQCKKQEEYNNDDMLNINRNKEEGREIKKSLTKKLRQSWMCCSQQ